MTERDWLEGTDPRPMLAFLRDRASERKLRLFACACCRRIQHLFVNQESHDAVRVAEEYADGLTDQTTFRNAWVAASHVKLIRKTRKKDSSPEKRAAWVASLVAFPETFQAAESCAGTS